MTRARLVFILPGIPYYGSVLKLLNLCLCRRKFSVSSWSLVCNLFFSQNKENIHKKHSNGLIQRHIQVRRLEGYAAAEKRQMTKTIDLCCVEGQEIQGWKFALTSVCICKSNFTSSLVNNINFPYGLVLFIKKTESFTITTHRRIDS